MFMELFNISIVHTIFNFMTNEYSIFNFMVFMNKMNCFNYEFGILFSIFQYIPSNCQICLNVHRKKSNWFRTCIQGVLQDINELQQCVLKDRNEIVENILFFLDINDLCKNCNGIILNFNKLMHICNKCKNILCSKCIDNEMIRCNPNAYIDFQCSDCIINDSDSDNMPVLTVMEDRLLLTNYPLTNGWLDHLDEM